VHIQHVTMRNFRSHRHLEQPLQQGLIGIFGANGTGKSNFVNGTAACLTNDFSRFPGVKTDSICDLAAAGEEAFIEDTVEHDGKVFTLRRSLRPNGSELRIHGEKPVREVEEIERRLQSELGVDPKLVNTYVFVEQWQIFAFLSATPAVRAEAFRHLCRTGKATKIYEACGQFLTGLKDEQELVDNSDELLSWIGEKEGRLASLAAPIEAQRKLLLNETSKESAQQILKKRERQLVLQGQLQKLQDHAEGCARALLTCRPRQAEAQTLLQLATQKQAGLQATYEAALLSQQQWEEQQRQAQRLQRLQAERTRLLAEQSVKPKEPEGYGDQEATRKTLATGEVKLQELENMMAGLDQLRGPTCPMCQQPVDQEFIQRKREELRQWRAELPLLARKVAAWDTYEVALAEWRTQRSRRSDRLKSLEDELQHLQAAPTTDEAGPEVWASTVADYRQAVKQVESARRGVQDAETAVQVNTEAEKRLARQITETSLELDGVTVSDALYEKATRRLQEHQAAVVEYSRLETQREETQRSLQQLQQALERLRLRLRRNQRSRRAARLVEQVRDLFHWSWLPQAVAQGNLVRMTQDINHTLAKFDDVFWAEADDNLSFRVHFPGCPPRRGDDLSGGQQVLLALAMRYAVGKLFAMDVGTLWLDEPTAGLDEKNVVLLQETLATFANELRGRRQLAIVTHETELKSAFDQVIQF